MRVLLTGATGFIGRHVARRLRDRGHEVIAAVRDADQAAGLPWLEGLQLLECDLHRNPAPLLDAILAGDAMIHLAWAGLPRYQEFFHVGRNLPADIAFLEAAVSRGVSHLLVTGTCLEYGMQHGPLAEGLETRPCTAYGMAKDMLRRCLALLQSQQPFTLQWLRLFYVHGEGQNPNSLLAMLDAAIARGDKHFDMSQGDQLRDFIPVETVASNVEQLLHRSDIQGTINCCSGKPMSVLDVVQQRCRERGATLLLNRGRYPYPAYEPMAFWGEHTSLDKLEHPT